MKKRRWEDRKKMLEVKNVRKLYDNKNGIQKANFALKEGELCALLGRNGSGKTTLLKCILGLCEIDDGEILFSRKTGKSTI